MKNSRTVLTALALASATLFAPTAFAGTVASVNQDIVLVNNEASIEHLLTGGNAGSTFSDRYNFSTAASGDLNALLTPRAKNANSALSITGFSLFDSKGTFVAQSSTAANGGYLIDFDNLAAGNYYLQVNGALMSNAAVKYLANVSIGQKADGAAVPEPASAALMLAGLGLLGVTARRRKRSA
jgi:hypothetical protein